MPDLWNTQDFLSASFSLILLLLFFLRHAFLEVFKHVHVRYCGNPTSFSSNQQFHTHMTKCKPILHTWHLLKLHKCTLEKFGAVSNTRCRENSHHQLLSGDRNIFYVIVNYSTIKLMAHLFARN